LLCNTLGNRTNEKVPYIYIYIYLLAADLVDVDEASRVGVEVMTATETLTPDRTPHSRSWNLDVDVMAASESLTPDRSPRNHSWISDSP